MNAALLSDLLLELNVLNPQELKREVMRLGAHVSEPRAQKWFKRVVAYWLVNIDKLSATPYKAQAEPRTIRGGKYHFHPAGHWQGEKTPQIAAQDPSPSDLSGAFAQTYQQHKVMGLPTGSRGCFRCGGTGHIMPPPTERKGVQSPESYPVCEICKGTGLTESMRLVAQLLDEQDEPQQPDPEGTYTSMLHQPDIEKHIGQSFTKFEKPSQARGWLPGQPPTKAKTPQWATPEKELHHFDPVQARRREQFDRLNNLVHYLNWEHHLMSKLRDPKKFEADKAAAKQEMGDDGVQQVESEQRQAIEAKELFRTLETMRTEDIDGFRKQMRDAQEFSRMVVEMPWLFHRDAQMVGSRGNIKIIKVITGEVAQTLAKRRSESGEIPVWCTKDQRAFGYVEQGPLYYVDKNGFPWVLMHFETNQCHDIHNSNITVPEALELVPALTNQTEFPLEKFGTPASDAQMRDHNQPLGFRAVANLLRRMRRE